jgi:hypothetical protein
MPGKPTSVVRRFASGLLEFVADHSSDACREWAAAMLRELDFIESDWDALLWALGSVMTIFRRGGVRWFRKRLEQREGRMNQNGKNTLGVMAGIGIGVAVSLVVIGLRVLAFQSIPNPQAGEMPWRLFLLIFALPEIVFVSFILALWRKRRPMAIGIMVIALLLVAHIAVHFSHHFLHG